MSYSRPLYLTSPQMYGDDVIEVQTRLSNLGYNPGSIDGYFGPNTESAIIAFQGKNGLTQDGSCGPATWNKLFSSSAISNSSSGYTRPLYLTSPQMYGNDVIQVQTRLSNLGYNPGSIDGYFGPNTESAIIAFQGKNGLTQDGSCGPATWNKLFSSSAKSATFTNISTTKKPTHGSSYKIYFIVPRSQVSDLTDYFNYMANKDDSSLYDNISLLGGLLGCISVFSCVGLPAFLASVVSLKINGTKSFYAHLFSQYGLAASALNRNISLEYALFSMPLVYHDPDWIGSNGMSQGTNAYWIPSYTNFEYEKADTEIALISTIASKEGSLANISTFFNL